MPPIGDPSPPVRVLLNRLPFTQGCAGAILASEPAKYSSCW